MRKLAIIKDSAELTKFNKENKIIFVPTMGDLHDGHLALINKANELAKDTPNAKVCVSIYVNPLQFAANEDYDTYPRNLDEDLNKMQGLVDICYIPSDKEMYPHKQELFITAPELGSQLCGKFRPNFFTGVLTVVYKLFNIVNPSIAIFGEKDYQQLILIKKLVEQFSLDISIVAESTIRNNDGLALSSRNKYLQDDEIEIANNFYHSLKNCASMIHAGVNLFDACNNIKDSLNKLNIKVDYFEARNLDLTTTNIDIDNFIVLGAIHIGTTRLIDNYIVRR